MVAPEATTVARAVVREWEAQAVTVGPLAVPQG